MSIKPPPLPKFTSFENNSSKKIKKKRKSRFDQAPPGLNEAKSVAKKIASTSTSSTKESSLEKALLMARKFAATTPTSSGVYQFEAKVPIPDELLMDKNMNFVGLIIGPGGNTQKRLQRDLQAKINILAPGGEKVSKDTTEGLYFLVSAMSQSRLDVAVAYLNTLISDPAQRRALQRDQGFNSGIPLPQTYFPFDSATIAAQSRYNPEMIFVPSDKVGVIIGKGGETAQEIMKKSGALIKVEREHNPNHPMTREVTIQGSPEQVKRARELISIYINERGPRIDGQTEFEDFLSIPQNLIGIIIGKMGETIKKIQKVSQCAVQVVPQGDPTDPNSIKVVKLRGTMAELNAAKYQINLLTSKYQTNPDVMNKPIGLEVEIIAIPINCVGTLLGRGGESVKRLAFLTGTRIQILTPEEQAEPGFDCMQYKKISIRGDKECIAKAKKEIQNLIDIIADQPNSPAESVNPYSATTPEESYALTQKYLAQQSNRLPEWASSSNMSTYQQFNGNQGGYENNNFSHPYNNNFNNNYTQQPQIGMYQQQMQNQNNFLLQNPPEPPTAPPPPGIQ